MEKLSLKALYEDLGIKPGPVTLDDPRLERIIDRTSLEGALLFQEANLNGAMNYLVQEGWLSEEKGRFKVTYKGLEELNGDYSN